MKKQLTAKQEQYLDAAKKTYFAIDNIVLFQVKV